MNFWILIVDYFTYLSNVKSWGTICLKFWSIILVKFIKNTTNISLEDFFCQQKKNKDVFSTWNLGTVDPTNHEYGEGDGDVFTYSHLGISHGDLKRFSYPRPSNHCPTCSCQHRVITDALLLYELITCFHEFLNYESTTYFFKKNYWFIFLWGRTFWLRSKVWKKIIVYFNNNRNTVCSP